MGQRDLKCEVLLVEDNPVNTELVKAILDSLECTVTAVAKGGDAIEAFKEKRFHLVLLDFHLPDMDGDQVATALRAIESSRLQIKPTRIAALTASAMPDELRRCIASGMDEVLAKPIDIAGLRALAVEAFQEVHNA